eukprot:TRINITY_DN11926_c0_g1_i2.p1 TRINITY_DN11926_c0_g1~~TRINITY_DN11926_c0_g1_i2.p1  ORF type:complete len:306 (+),score=60.33 TRINITY_DN11926_c0_g1_i2:75-992(+)
MKRSVFLFCLCFERTRKKSMSELIDPLLSRQETVHCNEAEEGGTQTRKKQALIDFLCFLFSKCTKWLIDVVVASTTWIGRGFSCVCAQRRGIDGRITIDFTPIQEERWQRLRSRVDVTFDANRAEHQEALKALWYASFPGWEYRGPISEQWKEMGWQGKDPSTDFRGGGFISLENLLFFAKTYPNSFQRLLQKQQGNRAVWEYPFAVAGVNLTFMLIQMLDLRSEKPSTVTGAVFLKMLAEDEWAFDLLYCIAFEMMDAQWLARRASYMDFNAVLKATRVQLEKELQLEDVFRLEDMPSYALLTQ